MTRKMEGPGALAGAAEAEIEKGLQVKEYHPSPVPATLSRLRAAHVSRLLGVSDQAAATIASLCFAGVAS